MGRHTKIMATKPAGRPAAATSAEARDAGSGRRLPEPPAAADSTRPAAGDRNGQWGRWIGRVPLLPVVAGAGAIAVVAAAYGTSQVQLNFSGGAPSVPRCATPDCGNAQADAQRRPEPRPDASTGPSRASRSAARAAPVSVVFRTTSRWNGGFQGTATITNRSQRPIRGWTFAFRYSGAQINTVWDVVIVRTGGTVVVRNPEHAPTLDPGDSVEVSYTAAGSGSPTACVFNGRACRTHSTP